MMYLRIAVEFGVGRCQNELCSFRHGSTDDGVL